MKRRVAILGSTGSIGTQALDVIRRHRDMFEVELLCANNSVELLSQQAREFDANNVVICNEDRYKELSDSLSDTFCKVFAGIDSVCSLVTSDNVDMVVGAMVGFSGLRPVLAALGKGKTVALANKETLVAAGSVVTKTAIEGGGRILPVDSEHSAIYQCLLASNGNELQKIHLTASGGPFRNWKKDDIAKATFEQALKHPNWNMGSKVTIDSASMMNKGFEMIEAKWLFDVAPENINVVVHPESVIHSMVEFRDGAVIAQLGCPDMRQPIGFALCWPQRVEVGNRKLDFAALGSLTFQAPDTGRFPNLALAFESIKRGGNIPCALNAANEVAVAEYLKGNISFYGISDVLEKCMAATDFIKEPGLDDIFRTHELTMARAKEMIGR